MAININLTKTKLSKIENNPLKLHYVPANIETNCPANVETYFNQYTINVEKDNDKPKIFENSLRGRPLKGIRFDLPPNTRGIIAEEAQKLSNDNGHRNLKVSGTFEDFIYWNYDRIPSKTDPLRKAVHIFNISEKISEPVTEEEIKQSLVEMEKFDKPKM